MQASSYSHTMSLIELEKQWGPLEGGLRHSHPELRNRIGIFRVRLGNRIMFVGCATEFDNGGLSKRLGDFTRPGASGRDHYAGAMIRQHRDEVEIDVLFTSSDAKGAELAKGLKAAFIRRYRPAWNVPRRVHQRQPTR